MYHAVRTYRQTGMSSIVRHDGAEAMRNALRQVAAAIEEMRQRMAQLQETTLGAAATATGTAAAVEGGRGQGSGRTS